MIKNLILLCFILAGCGNNGIEGYVSEPITITAKQPENETNYDYFWVLSNQPDGSLMNSNDLISKNDGNEMTFIPDYPGDYSIEVIISEYGDEVSTQIFNFSILDFQDKEPSTDVVEVEEEDLNEEWLNEEIEDQVDNNQIDESQIVENQIDENQNDNQEVDTLVLKNKKPANQNKSSKTVKKNKITIDKQSKVLKMRKYPDRNSNIAERTDRYTIQITSKKMLRDAQLFSQELIKKGYDAYIQKVVFKSNETFYRVRIGSYDNHDSAKIAANALSEELGMTAWVDFVRKEQ